MPPPFPLAALFRATEKFASSEKEAALQIPPPEPLVAVLSETRPEVKTRPVPDAA